MVSNDGAITSDDHDDAGGRKETRPVVEMVPQPRAVPILSLGIIKGRGIQAELGTKTITWYLYVTIMMERSSDFVPRIYLTD